METDMKKLIVNADDFGLHESVNEAIEDAHRHGIVTSTSLVVNGTAFEHARDIAKRNRKLNVGLHLNFTDEKSVADPNKVRSLMGANGRFCGNHTTLFLKILRGEIKISDIVTETEAQIKKFYQTGLKPTHIDGHRHVHLFSPIFNALKPLFKKYHIERVRYLNIPYFEFKRGNLFKKLAASYLKTFSLLNKRQYVHQDYFLGFFDAGHMDKDYFAYLLRKIKPGITEVNFHPGKDNKRIEQQYGAWNKDFSWTFNWEREFSLLLSDDIKKLIKQHNITLVKYSEI